MTCFHGMPGLNAGFDVAFSSRTSSQLKIRVLHKIIPAAVLPVPPPNFPGPLTSEPGTPALSLVRSNAARAEAKKTAVIAYLSGRADEIRQGLAYLSTKERQTAEGKLILVSLLKVMVENDGKLLGTCVSIFSMFTLVERASPTDHKWTSRQELRLFHVWRLH